MLTMHMAAESVGAGDCPNLSPFGMHRAETILARFPGPVTLQIRRSRKLVSFALCLGLTVASAWAVVVASKDTNEWIGFAPLLAFFAALTVRVAIATLVPGVGSLTIDADGLACKLVFRTTRISWQDVVRDFREDTIRRLRVVTFEVIAPSAWRGVPTKTKRILQDNFELGRAELAWLMNEWHRRALAQAPTPEPGFRGSVPKIGRRSG